MIYLQVYADSLEAVTRQKTAEQWDRDDTYTEWFISDIVRKQTQNSYHALPVAFDVNVGDRVFLVYATYSFGDSFGHDENGGLELCGFYQTQEEAEAEKLRLAAIDDHSVPWNGYFNHLNQLEVKEVQVV